MHVTVENELTTGNNVKVKEGHGNGFLFWDDNDHYFKIHKGDGSAYNYGNVNSYSIKTTIAGNSSRGFT
jgi:hypothetical protein